MSKTKKLKQKTTAFDIVYRVVTALMAALSFPLAFFNNMIFIVIMHEDVSILLDKLLGAETSDPGGTYLEWSIADIFRSSSSLNLLINSADTETFSISSLWDNVLLRAVLFAVIFFTIALVLALIIFFFALFSNKIKVIIGLSLGGFIATIVSFISFTVFFANPITSDKISLGAALNIKGFLQNILLNFVDVTVIKLDGAFFSVMFLMLGILIWSVSVLIVNKGEEKEKAMKEAARKHR